LPNASELFIYCGKKQYFTLILLSKNAKNSQLKIFQLFSFHFVSKYLTKTILNQSLFCGRQQFRRYPLLPGFDHLCSEILTPQGVREMSLRPSVSLSFLLVSLYFFYDVNTIASLAFQHFFLGFIHLSATHFQDSSASFAAIM
jgi:hypothetical protein